MHTNYRRKQNKKRRDKKGFPRPYSVKECRKLESHWRRQVDRKLMAHERYDDLPTRYPRDILWNWW